MAHVLVVHHDPDMADQETDWLRQAGYTVEECSGPSYGPCPILHDRPCPAVEGADVLVYDVWASGDTESERDLIERLRDLHPGIPIVLTSPGMEFDWVETAGAHAVVPLDGAPSAATLRQAVERALGSVGKGAAPIA
jgi:DNA-binding NtrC family response regulator